MSGDHKGKDADAHAVEELAIERGFYRARPVEALDPPPALFNGTRTGCTAARYRPLRCAPLCRLPEDGFERGRPPELATT
jgi:hypothetical protein